MRLLGKLCMPTEDPLDSSGFLVVLDLEEHSVSVDP